jgi:HPt (histidine-containing phosphotransfer) domain-containing protein
MINIEAEKSIENVCNLSSLSKMMGGKKPLIKDIIDVFLKQLPEELQFINDGIAKTDYTTIKNYAHTMRSSIAIMGISILAPVLQEMENSAKAGDMEKIKELNPKLNLICRQVIDEIEREKHNYI